VNGSPQSADAMPMSASRIFFARLRPRLAPAPDPTHRVAQGSRGTSRARFRCPLEIRTHCWRKADSNGRSLPVNELVSQANANASQATRMLLT
jgi:hypothetical protein